MFFSFFSSVAGRIQTLNAISHDSPVQHSVPWMPSKPRFTVVDNENQQRRLPDLQPIHRSTKTPSPAEVVDEPDDPLQVQIKMNNELLRRIQVLEEEKKAAIEEKKNLLAIIDKMKKEHAFFKATSGQTVVAAFANKENVDSSNQQ